MPDQLRLTGLRFSASQALEELTEQGNPLNLFLTRMFSAFDLNNNGTVDLEELISGLSIYFKGTLDERLECKC